MASTTLLSFEEFERLDWGADDLELLRGELIRMPPPKRKHSKITHCLYDRVKAAVERLRSENPGVALGEVLMEEGYKFDTRPFSWLRPDVSITHPAQPAEDFFFGAPLIVFEVVSPSQTIAELEGKVAEYLANGAAEVWLLYSWKRHARVYEASNRPRLETEAIRTPLLPGIEIPLSEIFPAE